MPHRKDDKQAPVAPAHGTERNEAVSSLAHKIPAGENRDLRVRSAVVEELRRKLDAVAAQLAIRPELGAFGEELRLSLSEAGLLAENLDAANSALSRANLDFERRLADRAAKLEDAEDTMGRNQEHLRLIFENATEYAIFTLDLEGRVTSWNPGARRILGFEEGEILRHPADIIFTPEDRARRQAELEMCRAVEEGHARDERWHQRADGSRFWAVGMMMPLLDPGGELRGFLKILCDHTERRRDEERGSLVLREMDHRVKNILATVQSVAAQTLRQAEAPATLRDTLNARLRALARSHDMLSRGGWAGALLSDVIERTLEPYTTDGEAGRVSLEGPPVRLTPSITVTLNLALHELATNAAKYGALSAEGGRVEVSWVLERRANVKAPPMVVILWRERGGPRVRPPERRGFGSQLLERVLSRESGGDVGLDFAPKGVECRIRLPLALPSGKDSSQ
jgi:PAS domain S-box-containing protein